MSIVEFGWLGNDGDNHNGPHVSINKPTLVIVESQAFKKPPLLQ